MKASLNPYLIFNGNCAQAIEFYQSILGGKLKMSKYSEGGMPTSDEDKDKIIHARLENDTLTFMASDDNEKQRTKIGDNVHMSISGNDKETLTRYFNELLEGGKVDMPLAKQFWGDTFGMLTDKFGVHWMINISQLEQK